MATLDLPLVSVQHNLYEAVEDVVNNVKEGENVFVHTDKEHRLNLDKETLGNPAEVPDSVTLNGISIRIAPVLFRIDKKKRVSCGDATNDTVLYGTTDGDVFINPVYFSDSQPLTPHILHTNVALFLPSENALITAGMDFSANVYSTSKLSKPAHVLRKQKGMITDIAFNNNSVYTLCTADSTVCLWTLDPEEVATIATPPGSKCISYNKQTGLLIGAADGLYRVDGETLELEKAVGLSVNEILFLKTNSQLAVYASETVVVISSINQLSNIKFSVNVPLPIQQILLSETHVYIRTEPACYEVCLETMQFEVFSGECQYMALSTDYIYLLSFESRRFKAGSKQVQS